MFFKVPLIICLSLVSFTFSLNVINYLSTGRPTQGNVQNTTGILTNIVDSSKNRTSNGNNSSSSNETITVSVSSQNASTQEEFNEDFYQTSVPGNVSVDVGVKWDDVNNLLKLKTRVMLETSNFKDAVRRANSSDVCKAGLERYLNSLSDLETWSVKMADANGKLGGGLLGGRFMSLGSYEECLKIRVHSAEDVEEFRGQFCMSIFRSPLFADVYLKNGSLNRQYLETYGEPPQWIEDFLLRMGPTLKIHAFSLGTCVPSTCSDTDLAQVITRIVSPLGMSVEVVGCQVEKPMTWTKSLIAAVSVLSSLALLCTVGTITDITNRDSANMTPEENKSNGWTYTTMKLLKMFSVPSNIQILVNGRNRNSFGCLDGVRFLMSTWVVLYHTYDSESPWQFYKFRNALVIKEDFNDNLPLAAIDNISIAMVCFFFVSGFLMSYLMWRKLDKGRAKVNFVSFFLHKYWRLTPCIALTLAVFAVVAHTGSGPLWNTTMGPEMETCNTNWWRTFLYISNWSKMEDRCLKHTWFLSCLMQLHVIGFIIIQITFRWPMVGVLLGVLIVFGCSTLVVIIAILKKIPLPMLLAQKDLDIVASVCSWFLCNPFYYMQSYVIGMVLGYLVLKNKDKKIKQRYQAIGWVLSIIGSIYAVYGIYGPQNSIEFKAFYYGFSFIAWSASLGWLIYACIAGYGGMLNSFLSWKGFHLLSNISYLIYLLHLVVVYYSNASLKELVNYGYYEMMSSYLSVLSISIFLAFVGHVTVEMPFSHLEKVIL